MLAKRGTKLPSRAPFGNLACRLENKPRCNKWAAANLGIQWRKNSNHTMQNPVKPTFTPYQNETLDTLYEMLFCDAVLASAARGAWVDVAQA